MFSSSSHHPSPSPRPILKRAPKSSNHAVHFPPSPTLTRTFFAHSSSSYDRSPITVAPNACAMPERGCPGRTYVPGTTDDHSGRHLHPRVVATSSGLANVISASDRTPRTSASTSSPGPPPPLIPDLSSESDESDGFASPPQLFVRQSTGGGPLRAMFDGLSLSDENARRFLPHSLPPAAAVATTPEQQRHPRYDPRQQPWDGASAGPKAKKRRDGKHRRLHVGREADPLEDEEDEEGDHRALDEGSYKSFSTTSLLGGCRLDDNDEGCLAGF
ncbi:hypothetical protein PUNSTDRAFT_47928 [Punctularia strigosozonata HHB-11173 SS5]|uniref:Uncharacterized protein n=1 Tax=Punctularia strigosozonata (strain HHB-11173) TaxID=741275 RepID=R7S1M9_PUNST|nr:uncharacterized protein PUNSTDRAFT_47928 [Punctularia strigosozonata HHB-11173 SS5]EIN03734.1 hypothetical protein PUNSTDRAFT_47928 [Punctularia strigosozonata HHB-11173 SS5]